MTDSKYIPRLKLVYKNEIVPALIKDMNISNVMLVPKIEKIVINMGLGDAKLNKNGLKQAQEELSSISGQKCVITYYKCISVRVRYLTVLYVFYVLYVLYLFTLDVYNR